MGWDGWLWEELRGGGEEVRGLSIGHGISVLVLDEPSD